MIFKVICLFIKLDLNMLQFLQFFRGTSSPVLHSLSGMYMYSLSEFELKSEGKKLLSNQMYSIILQGQLPCMKCIVEVHSGHHGFPPVGLTDRFTISIASGH